MKTDAAQRQRVSDTGAPGSKVGRLATGPAAVKSGAGNDGFQWEQQVHEPPSSESVILSANRKLMTTDATAPKMKRFCCGLF